MKPNSAHMKETADVVDVAGLLFSLVVTTI